MPLALFHLLSPGIVAFLNLDFCEVSSCFLFVCILCSLFPFFCFASLDSFLFLSAKPHSGLQHYLHQDIIITDLGVKSKKGKMSLNTLFSFASTLARWSNVQFLQKELAIASEFISSP